MPEELSQEAISLLAYLLPGFLSAWVFYGLTSHPKPSQFERVIQALIFTFIVQTILPLLPWVLSVVGFTAYVADWGKTEDVMGALLLAIIFGALLAYLTNNDTVHSAFRKVGFTTRTSHPSEWFYVFSNKVTFVILHLKDGRRLYGWPKEWPIDPNKGQFYIMLPSWIEEDGSQIDLSVLEGILVNATDVQWVEFLQIPEEVE